MVARPFRCDTSRLKLLLDDRLEDEEQAELSRHLEKCASCRRGLEQLAAESRWWGDARLLANDVAPTCANDIPAPEGFNLGFLAPPPGPGMLGMLGPYEVIEVIGRGGMGLVLKAFDRPLGRYVAIKLLAPELATSATAHRRFDREARAAAAITHDHIVAIYAIHATPESLPYIVMQYVSGRSVQDRLDKTGPFDLRGVLRVGLQAASGLAAAHAVGLVHRDVKPANILLENCVERVKLTDFGLARAADDASLTQSGVVAGTPQYMSPEQARGESVDARSDLFSLGSVLYALYTGRPPFRAETTMGVLRRVSEDTPRPIREVNPDVPEWMQAIVDRLQAKDPAARFQSATEVADLLERCLAYLERPGKVPPYVAGDVSAAPRRARAWGVGLAVVALAVVGLGASEASGVSKVAEFVATVLRIKTPKGTLVVKLGDPDVKVRVDGKEITITGAGPEVRLSLDPGAHAFEKVKGGKVEQTWITIQRGREAAVTATFEPDPEKTSASENAAERLEAMQGRVNSQLKARQDEAEIKRLHEQMRELQALVPAYARLDPRLKALNAARKRLEASRLTARNENDPRLQFLREQVRQLEEELRGAPITPHEALASGSQAEGANVPPASAPKVARKRRIDTETAVYCIALTPDGKLLAVGCEDGKIILYDVVTGKVRAMLEGHKMEVRGIAFAPDGKTLASAAGTYTKHEATGELKLWNVPEGRLIRDLAGHTAMVWAVAFSPDGRTLASGSWDKTARLWDVPTGKMRAVLEGHTDAVRFVAFSPSRPDGPIMSSSSRVGASLATASFDGDVRFWHNAPGQPYDGQHWSTHHAFDDGVNCIAFAPDNKTLAVCRRPRSADSPPDEVILLDLTTWKERARLKGHRRDVLCVAFSPDGRMLATGGGFVELPDLEDAGEIFLWDVDSKQVKARFTDLEFRAESLTFTPDGQTLLSGGGISELGGEVRFRPLSVPAR